MAKDIYSNSKPIGTFKNQIPNRDEKVLEFLNNGTSNFMMYIRFWKY